MKLWALLLLLLSGCLAPVETQEDDMAKDRAGNSGGWSATGTMFNDGQSQAAHLQVNFLEKDGNPTPSKNYTVQFSVGPTLLRSNKQLSTIVPVNPVAEIKWSVEGNDVRRVVSVTNGLSLTGVGEAIKVSVSDQSFSNFFNTPIQYDVGITVAPGSRASVQQPPTLALPGNQSFKYPIAGGATSGMLAIPQNAGVISVYCTVGNTSGTDGPIPDQAAQVRMFDPGGNLQRLFDPRDGWVPVTPGASQLLLQNNSAFNQTWSVTFGIDG